MTSVNLLGYGTNGACWEGISLIIELSQLAKLKTQWNKQVAFFYPPKNTR